MNNVTTAFAPSTWRVLGLSVATGYTCLGASAMFSPRSTSRVFGLPLGTKPTNDDPVARSFKLLGIRDISVAAALFTFSSRNQPESMGVLILSTMLICAWDVYECARNNGVGEASVLGVGAAIWTFIGIGLSGLKSYD